ncbi:unnamed protein product [Microthlaspi erraticum]|uniref:Dof zinc finger protein n=1 Tax=Microthlaspi erraticum TaxID=1685480 RepID=A0A6D2LMN2_9BRAS|nr:unnamed protein product [Microthlaspi erraticum]
MMTAKQSELPEQEQQLKCPRCDSLNTKLCYFDNYNQSQPSHFCKSCRCYWTKGGALRKTPSAADHARTSNDPYFFSVVQPLE